MDTKPEALSHERPGPLLMESGHLIAVFGHTIKSKSTSIIIFSIRAVKDGVHNHLARWQLFCFYRCFYAEIETIICGFECQYPHFLGSGFIKRLVQKLPGRDSSSML